VHETHEANGVGFTAPDAPRLSKLAEKIMQEDLLSEEEEWELCYRLPKYWQQFTRLMTLADLESTCNFGEEEAA
jgi:hypothetical protein